MPRYLSHQRFQLDARVERSVQDVVLTVQHPRREQNRIADRLQADGFVVGPDGGALQGVEQLANIARPGMLKQKISCGSRKFLVPQMPRLRGGTVDLCRSASISNERSPARSRSGGSLMIATARR
jgi:hypothetical protein